MVFSIIMFFFSVLTPGSYAVDNNFNSTSSSYSISILDNSVGGNVLANPEINQNIPKTEFSKQIFNLANQGSVVVKLGNGNGPKLLISAGIHGDEEEANISAMKYLEYVKDKNINGTLYVIPFDIPINTAQNIRYYKGYDPNRVADISGTPSWNIVKFALEEGIDYLIDVHSGSGVYHEGLIYANSPAKRTLEESKWISYIKSQTGCYVAVNSDDSPGMIRNYANSKGINSITLEVEIDNISTVLAAETEFKMIMAAAQYLGFPLYAPNPVPNPASNTVTMSQVGYAADTVKNYYENNKILPSSVTIANQPVSMPTLLYLLTTATLQANSGSTTPLTLKTVNTATSPSGSIKSGNIYKSEFITTAQNILSYISNNNRAPDYMSTSLGNISFDKAVYMYSKIINYYKNNGRLPSYVSMTASSSPTPPPVPNPASNTVTMSQVSSAADTVKNYYENNKILPSSVTIANQPVSMPTLLYLLTTATLQVNSGSTAPITLKTVNTATSPSGSIKSGNIYKSEFITTAQNILSYISNNNRAPDYMSTSLGNISFDKAVYMYSKIINYYKNNYRLPNYVSM